MRTMPSFRNRVELDVKMAPKLPKTAAKKLKRAVRRARKVKLREEDKKFSCAMRKARKLKLQEEEKGKACMRLSNYV